MAWQPQASVAVQHRSPKGAVHMLVHALTSHDEGVAGVGLGVGTPAGGVGKAGSVRPGGRQRLVPATFTSQPQSAVPVQQGWAGAVHVFVQALASQAPGKPPGVIGSPGRPGTPGVIGSPGKPPGVIGSPGRPPGVVDGVGAARSKQTAVPAN